MARIERLYNLDGGCHVGILFLLQPSPGVVHGSNMIPFMELQTQSVIPLNPSTQVLTAPSIFSSSFEIPLIPLVKLSSLPATLSSFQTQIIRQQAQSVPRSSAISVLPYCSSNPPLPEHTRNVLSDVCQNFKELTKAVTTADGKAALGEWLENPVIVGQIVDFWLEEYFVE